MNIGSLFVTIGLKGGAKTQKELKGVGQELTGISKRGLAAFTALAGISYGLAQLTKNALNTGSSLTKFSNFTGLSAERLQKWQYMARQSGVAAEEVKGNVESLSGVLSEMALTGKFNGEFLRISEITNIDPSRLKDTFYILEKFKEFSRSGLPTDAVNNILGKFISPDMIQFLRTTSLSEGSVPDGAIQSKRQLRALQDFKVMFDNFQSDLERRFASLFVKIGPKVIPKLTELAKEIINLTEALITFLNNNKVFDMFKHLIMTITKLLKGDFSGATEEMGRFGDLEISAAKKFADFLLAPNAGEAAASISSLQAIHRKNFPQGYGADGKPATYIFNQTNNGVSAKDSSMIASKTAAMFPDKPKMQMKNVNRTN